MSKSTITDNTQNDGLLNTTTINEFSNATTFVVPSEDRDFSRPKEPFMNQTFPEDSALANDGGKDWVKQIQKIMKGNPISPSYPGPIDGKINRKLLDVLLNFSWTLKRKTGKSFNLINGNSINQSQFLKAMVVLKNFLKPKKKIKTEEVTLKKNEIVLAFQKFFSSSHPIIGTLYNGSKDGEINSELITAAQKAEGKISLAINNKSVKGMIWGGDNFSTSPDDVSTALNFINQYKQNT